MNDTNIYLIQVLGQVDEAEINPMSPLSVMVAYADKGRTLLTVSTDQSGLMGILRYLHDMGFVFLSICREITTPEG